jgi:ribonuclease VapC
MTRLVVDTSALMTLLLGEPDAERFEQRLFDSRGDVLITAANLLETMLVVEARNPDTGAQDLRTLVDVFAIGVEPVDHDLAELAFRGWKRFGRGRHSAALNYGDCFSYALAKHLDAPLLHKGDDFTHTDVVSAFR